MSNPTTLGPGISPVCRFTLTTVPPSPLEVRTLQLAPNSNLTLGRSSRSEETIQADKDNAFFNCPVVSRAHAEISCRARGDLLDLFIVDNDSRHGTVINGRKLPKGERFELKSGDIIKLGEAIMHYDARHEGLTLRYDRLNSIVTLSSSSGAQFGVADDVDDSDHSSEEEDAYVDESRSSLCEATPASLEDDEVDDEEEIEMEYSDDSSVEDDVIGVVFAADAKGDDDLPELDTAVDPVPRATSPPKAKIITDLVDSQDMDAKLAPALQPTEPLLASSIDTTNLDDHSQEPETTSAPPQMADESAISSANAPKLHFDPIRNLQPADQYVQSRAILQWPTSSSQLYSAYSHPTIEDQSYHPAEMYPTAGCYTMPYSPVHGLYRSMNDYYIPQRDINDTMLMKTNVDRSSLSINAPSLAPLTTGEEDASLIPEVRSYSPHLSEPERQVLDHATPSTNLDHAVATKIPPTPPSTIKTKISIPDILEEPTPVPALDSQPSLTTDNLAALESASPLPSVQSPSAKLSGKRKRLPAMPQFPPDPKRQRLAVHSPSHTRTLRRAASTAAHVAMGAMLGAVGAVAFLSSPSSEWLVRMME